VHRGDRVADFELRDDQDRSVRLYELLERGPVVLFFYPVASSTGCTSECKYFRDRAEEFATYSAQRVGISPDPVERQLRFSEAHQFDFPLLSDPDGQVARAFGVRRSFGPLKTRRWTFVISTNATVLAVIKSEVRMREHADQALAVLAASN
jgi:peroxiredoxin Q/BCP